MRQIQTNCAKIRFIVETIILCGRQNIPLRGHRDSCFDLEREILVPPTVTFGLYLILG